MTYRAPELEIPLEDPFVNDILDRKNIVEFLAKFIDKVDGPFVLTLDSPWGTGKTTIVKMLEAVLKNANYSCIYFNAWKIDYITDPIVALVSSIDQLKFEETEDKTKFKKHVDKVKKVTSLIAKRSIVTAVKTLTFNALDLEEEVETAIAEFSGDSMKDIVDAFQEESSLLNKFHSELELAVKQLPSLNKKEKLIFFIDEIDRCRPTFAIEMLERIKHLFDVPNIIFVLSIDKAQLQSGISAVYGSNINSLEYLRRFIDLEYTIPKVKTNKFIESLFVKFKIDDALNARSKNPELQYDKPNLVETFSFLAETTSMTLRAQERCITRLKVVLDQTPDNHYLVPHFTALLIVLRTKNLELYTQLCSGAIGSTEVMEYLNTISPNKNMDEHLMLIIHAYLILLDKNEQRKKAARENLTKMIENEQKLNLTNTRNMKLMGMIENVYRLSQSSFDYIANKIDLASNLN